MTLLDGKKVKTELLYELKEKVSKIDKQLGLAVIQVGDNPASNVYVKNKEKMAQEVGYTFKHIKLAEDVSEDELISLIHQLNDDDNFDGILVQMPLPKHLNSNKIQNEIISEKDVDGLTDINMGKLSHKSDSLVPCTPMGIIDLCKYYNIEIEKKNVVIIGRSNLVGKPLASLFTNLDATVTLCHSKTKNLKDYTKIADILVVAVGSPNLIDSSYIKDKAVVIDVGINRVDKKLIGDVCFSDVEEKVSYITPVPGGVGQMTVAELGYNVYKAYLLRNKKDKVV